MRGSRARKLIDRFAGPPLLRLLGARRRRRVPTRLERVGILRTAAIGDTLLLSAILRDLRAALPLADIVLITGTDNAEAGRMVSLGVARRQVISVSDPFAAISALRRERLDLLIDTGAWPRFDALLAALSGARCTVGFRTPGQHRHYAYDIVAEHSRAVHELENHRALLRGVQIPTGSAPAVDPGALLPAPEIPPAPFIVIHPWASGFKAHLKEWPRERWVELGARLRDRIRTVVISGSAADGAASAAMADELTRRGVPSVSFAGLGIAETGSLMLQAAAVVSVNTGIMHLAGILGAPVVALEGPVSPRRWGALGPRVTTVTSTLPGCGFLHLGFEYDGQRADCMSGVSVDAAEAAVRRIIEGAA